MTTIQTNWKLYYISAVMTMGAMIAIHSHSMPLFALFGIIGPNVIKMRFGL